MWACKNKYHLCINGQVIGNSQEIFFQPHLIMSLCYPCTLHSLCTSIKCQKSTFLINLHPPYNFTPFMSLQNLLHQFPRELHPFTPELDFDHKVIESKLFFAMTIFSTALGLPTPLNSCFQHCRTTHLPTCGTTDGSNNAVIKK